MADATEDDPIAVAGPRPELPRESKLEVYNRLKREGRWPAASVFKDEVFDELHEAGIHGYTAKKIAWDEVRRRFPPLPTTETEEEKPGPSPGEGFGLLPPDWLPLPNSAPWRDELEWAYQNGFFVIAEKATGAVAYHWDRARTPPPSQGALVLMKLQAESRQKFMDLLGKAKAGADGDDAEGTKYEKRRIEEIQATIERFKEDEE